ncbi:hypothetical protein BJ875DRAFT_86184 [Amylocarpus encephaloides]|uniref:Uncharacterized protein n=1 Tax=Amylocarpus encephaloides TaxID=45428 RepID=A0A9P7YTU1_9HELO|nr:hypothetical protein BJ875DRAFT_86184 [Amylocarpus encephaloides]
MPSASWLPAPIFIRLLVVLTLLKYIVCPSFSLDFRPPSPSLLRRRVACSVVIDSIPFSFHPPNQPTIHPFSTRRIFMTRNLRVSLSSWNAPSKSSPSDNLRRGQCVRPLYLRTDQHPS